jgi:hypothetical protein
LPQIGTSSVVIGIPPPSRGENVTIGVLPLQLANEGEKSVDSAVLIIRYPLMMKRKALEEVGTFSISGPPIARLAKNITSDTEFDYATYQVDSLNPHVGMNAEEPIHLYETKLDANVPVSTKDGAHYVVSLSSLFVVKILATTIGRDIPATNYELAIITTHASSIQELAMYAIKTDIPAQRKELRGQLGFWQYMGGLVFRSDKGRIFLVLENLRDEKTKDGHMVGVPDGEPKSSEIVFNLLSWSYLFG